MTIKEAFEIVLDLAEQNVIYDEEMADERARQEQAIRIVRIGGNILASVDSLVEAAGLKEAPVSTS